MYFDGVAVSAAALRQAQTAQMEVKNCMIMFPWKLRELVSHQGDLPRAGGVGDVEPRLHSKKG